MLEVDLLCINSYFQIPSQKNSKRIFRNPSTDVAMLVQEPEIAKKKADLDICIRLAYRTVGTMSENGFHKIQSKWARECWYKFGEEITAVDRNNYLSSFRSFIEVPAVKYDTINKVHALMLIRGVHRKSDIDNMVSTVLDSLVREKVLTNDNVPVVPAVDLRFVKVSENKYTGADVIIIKKVKDQKLLNLK